MLRLATRRQFGLFSGLKNIAQTPLKYVNQVLTSGTDDHHPFGNITEKFEEEAHEWKSVVVENSYELNIFQSNDQIIQGNFGTVDNPHLIFTSDLPFRFVGCTGAPGEDDYEGHEIMYFLLREGPLQRCGSCGQVFKLVRLRDEESAQNDYYRRDFAPRHVQEMGEADHWIQLHALRFMMMNSYEHTHFETPSHTAFTLKNPDEHDRILVDPAYRMEQLALATHKYNVVNEVEANIGRAVYEQYGNTPVEFTKDNFENLVQAEIAIAHLNNHFKAVQRFNIRQFLDPANHQRREKRMLERSKERTQLSNTIYLNGHSENELKYRDYYESDSEALELLGVDAAAEKARILSNPEYNLKNFAFIEEYSALKNADASSYLDKKLFRFNYRQALFSAEDHQRKEARMQKRLQDSGFAEKAAKLAQQEGSPQEAKNAFSELALSQALDNYKNYFESDLEEDFAYVESLPLSEKLAFASTLQQNGLIPEAESEVMAITCPKDTDPQEGFLKQVTNFLENLEAEVAPQLANLNGVNRNQGLLDEVFEKLGKNSKQNSPKAN